MRRILKKRIGILAAVTAGLAGTAMMMSLASCGKTTEAETMTPEQKIERGKYIVMTAGCNDCHTDGFMRDAKIPEKEWMLGSPIGWKGPWGTTYAANVRKVAGAMSEEMFIKNARSAKNGTGRPPMPWASLAAMTDEDIGSLYAYLKKLGDDGVAMPADLKPGEAPMTPYFDMDVKNLPPGAGGPPSAGGGPPASAPK